MFLWYKGKDPSSKLNELHLNVMSDLQRFNFVPKFLLT